MCRGGGQVVSVLAFYSDNPSLNPAEAYSFSVKIVFEKTKNKQKIGRGWPIFYNLAIWVSWTFISQAKVYTTPLSLQKALSQIV